MYITLPFLIIYLIEYIEITLCVVRRYASTHPGQHDAALTAFDQVSHVINKVTSFCNPHAIYVESGNINHACRSG